MRKIIGLCTILVALLFTGCVIPSSVDAGEEAVLVKNHTFLDMEVLTQNQLKLD